MGGKRSAVSFQQSARGKIKKTIEQPNSNNALKLKAESFLYALKLIADG